MSMDFPSDKRRSHEGIREWNIIAFLGFLAIMSVHYIRVYINIPIPFYTKNPKLLIGFDSNPYVIPCHRLSPLYIKNLTSVIEAADRLNWTTVDEAFVLGGFYYGYAVTPLPAYLVVNANIISAKWMVGFGVLVAGSLGFLLPFTRVDSCWYMFFARVLQGLAVGIVSPAMSALLKKWFPDVELHFMRKLIFTGMPIGISLAFLMSGRTYEVELLIGWLNNYTLFGVLLLIWFILWSILVYDTPRSHRFLAEKQAERIDEDVKRDFKELSPIPWKRMVSSRYVWVLTTTHFLQDWNHHLLLINLPTYYNDVLHIGPHETGYLCCVAFLIKWLLSGLSHLLSEKLHNTLHFNVTNTRKFMNSISTFIPASFLMIVSLIICRPIEIVIFLTLATATTGLKYSGYDKIYSDLCPDYAEILRIVCGCITNVTGLLAPLYVGALTLNERYLLNWGFIFLTNATLLIAAGSVFVVFGSAEEQPWGKSEDSCFLCNIQSKSSTNPKALSSNQLSNSDGEELPTNELPKSDAKQQQPEEDSNEKNLNSKNIN